MKRILALVLTVLLLCGSLAHSVWAVEKPSASAETKNTDPVANSDSSADMTGSIDTAGLSNAVTAADGEKTTDTDENTVASGSLKNTVSNSVQVTALVLAVTPAAITLTRFDEPDRTDARAFAVGATQAEFPEVLARDRYRFTGYDAEGNSYGLMSGTWSFEEVDTGATGVYYASVTPDLGTEYVLADGVSLPQLLCAVSIQTPGEPDLNCCTATQGVLRFPWVLSPTQEDQMDASFAVWLRQDGGEWIQLNVDDDYFIDSESLMIGQYVFEDGSTYDLRAAYPGGQTGVATFQYSRSLNTVDYTGGDRDGGDAGGSGPLTGSQPAPTPPQTSGGSQSSKNHNSTRDSGFTPQDSQEGQDSSSSGEAPLFPTVPTESTEPLYSNTSPSHETESTASKPGNHTVPLPKESVKAVRSPVPDDNNTPSGKSPKSRESAAVTESYSPTQTIISGLRLKDLCADGKSVVFGSGDLTASIPSSLLLALNLSDSDTLSVRLTKPKSNQIALAVEVPGKSVTELTGTVLRLRYTPQSKKAKITVHNETDVQITDASYDGELLRFTANAAETYTILELSNTQETQKAIPPLFPVSGGLILAAGGITFFRRRRHG